ncbi:MAG: DNA repair protein RecO [Bacteroidota bacterium]
MIEGVSAIVLSSFPYSESSVISKCFTREYGLNSFVLKGAKSPGNKHKLAVLRSFQPVEVVHYRGRSDLHLIKEIRIDYPLHSIATNPEKTCIALFLSELLYKTLNDNVRDEPLFDFVLSSVKWLEHTDDYLNFHLRFMMQLSRYLGFYPGTTESFDRSYFGELDLGESRQEVNLLLNELIRQPEYAVNTMKITNNQRRELLRAMVAFYGIQLEKFLDIKSLPVLESIFSD